MERDIYFKSYQTKNHSDCLKKKKKKQGFNVNPNPIFVKLCLIYFYLSLGLHPVGKKEKKEVSYFKFMEVVCLR